MSKTFDQKLRHWRGDRSQVAACTALGVCRRTLQRWEAGIPPNKLTMRYVEGIINVVNGKKAP